MEAIVKIPVAKGKYIYGALRGGLHQTLVLFINGLTGDRDSHIFFNGARYLEKKHIPSLRLSFYASETDARRLEDITLSQLGQDLDTVVTYVKKKGVKKVFVVGHSYGGVVILLSKRQDFDVAVLWDTSEKPALITDPAKFIKELGLYYLVNTRQFGFTLGRAMIEDNRRIDSLELIKHMSKPIKIIAAGKGWLVESSKKMYERAPKEKALDIIPDASHSFSEAGTEEKLFKSTYLWLRHYL